MNISAAHDVITRAVTAYRLDTVWALFSGGHDSMCATHVASQHPAFAGVIHIDTGTGLRETEQYVAETCHRYGWTLITERPNITYEMLIVKYGFPGPAQHSLMYNMLKGRPLRKAKTAAAAGLRIGFVTGVRAQESDRRMGHVGEMRKDKEGVWINPIWDWSALDCGAYLGEYDILRNPVKDALHLSGECFCGAYAGANEYRELDFWYPYQARRIDAWEKLVATTNELGLNEIEPKFCKWGHSRRTPDEQMELFPLCQFCAAARGSE